MAKKPIKKKVSRVNITQVDAQEIADAIEKTGAVKKTVVSDKTDYSNISKDYIKKIQGNTGRPKNPETAHKVKYTTTINKDVLRLLRVIAGDLGMSANELIEKLTIEYLSANEEKYSGMIPDTIRNKF